MGTSNPRKLVEDWFDTIWNQGEADRIQEFLAPEAVLYDTSLVPGPTKDWAAMADSVRALREAIPDLNFAVDDAISEGEKVAARLTVTGTHTNGTPVSFSGMVFAEFRAGRVLEGWNSFDLLGFYEQLKVVKRPDPAAV